MNFRRLAHFVWRRFHLKAFFKQTSLLAHTAAWRILRWSCKDAVKRPVNNSLQALITPPDPLLISASKGDEAMLKVVIRQLREKHGDCHINVVVAEGYDHEAVVELGLVPQVVFVGFFAFFHRLLLLRKLGIDKCILIGADVLDGSYDPVFSARLLIALDIVSKMGATCHTTGFSFSERPSRGLTKIYGSFSPQIEFLLRDPKSFERFQKFTNARCSLVADVAFQMTASAIEELPTHWVKWISCEAEMNRKVVGINFHPLLLELNERHRIDEVIGAFEQLVNHLVLEKSVSVVLIEHDFRGSSADSICFKQLHARLTNAVREHVLYPTERLTASQIKCLVGLLNGVVTGRMHLLIASIGMGTPAVAVEYKDKMSGLISYFEQLKALRISSSSLLKNPGSLLAAVDVMLANEAQIRLELQKEFPKVDALSRRNLDF